MKEKLTFKETHSIEPLYKTYLTKEQKKDYKKLDSTEKKRILQEFDNMTLAEREINISRKNIIDNLKRTHPEKHIEIDITKIPINPVIENDFFEIDNLIQKLDSNLTQKDRHYIDYKIENIVNSIISNQYPTEKQIKLANLGHSMTSTGEKFQSVGNKMMSSGLKTTAVVWTPALYLGYKGIKHVKKQDASNINQFKNNNTDSFIQSELISFVESTERARKEGVITKEMAVETIKNYLDTKYI